MTKKNPPLTDRHLQALARGWILIKTVVTWCVEDFLLNNWEKHFLGYHPYTIEQEGIDRRFDKLTFLRLIISRAVVSECVIDKQTLLI